MHTIEVYVRGDAHKPARFWDYALRTNSGARFYIEEGFIFSQELTGEYKAMTDEQRDKVQFMYINGVKQF